MKKFLRHLLLFLIPICVLVLFYLLVIEPRYQVGRYQYNELGCLGFVYFDTTYNKNHISPLEDYLVYTYKPGDSIGIDDVLVIGDSYSQHYNMGNDSYPNFLAHKTSKHIWNFEKVAYTNPLTHYISLLTHGYRLPRTIILECGEYMLIDRLRAVDFSDTSFVYCVSPEQELLQSSQKHENVYSQQVHEITQIKARMFDYYKKRFVNPVKHLKLNTAVFSCKRCESDLYFDGSTVIHYATNDDILFAVQKIEDIWKVSSSKGINVIFLIPADRYDFYQEYIIDNKYMAKTELDVLSNAIQDSRFINTKVILTPLKDKGIRDIYWANDTHWSPLAAETVADYLLTNYID